MSTPKSLNAYEREQIERIRAWKSENPSIVIRTIEVIAYPITRYIQEAVPDTALQWAFDAANYLASEAADTGDILKTAGVNNIGILRNKDFRLSDDLADSVHNWAIGLAAASGGAAGAAGILGLAVDIPAVILLALRTIHKIGLCYGYECRSEMDRRFALGVLAASCATSMSEKTEALSVLRMIEAAIAQRTFRAMSKKAAGRQLSREGSVLAIRGLARQIGINLSKRKAAQVIPVIGAAVSASVNGWYIRDVGWAARRAFQERWLVDNRKGTDL